MNSLISAETIEAYRDTDFIVHFDFNFTLKIDQLNENLIDLYQVNSSSCCVFVTACNPFSEIVTNEKNIELQKSLENYLLNAGLFYIAGEGKNPSGNWQGEPSFLVFNLGIDNAKNLGVELNQNAIVWCGEDAIPKLILLR